MASSSPSSLPSDTPGLSVWANRLHHLAWLRKEWSSLEDISMQDINDFLVRTTAEAGKYFYLMDAPTNQPWVASVAMHARLLSQFSNGRAVGKFVGLFTRTSQHVVE